MSTRSDFSNTLVLPSPEWTRRKREHEERVRRWTDPHQERHGRGEKHPVYDFLFDYYAFRASWLRRWHPGLGIALTGDAAAEFLQWPEYHRTWVGIAVNPAAWPARRRDTLAWMERLLRGMQQRPAFFGCYGLHEWAMVYRLSQEEVRHQRLPLRLSPAEIQAVVEGQPVCCSHFDAFRFFTEPARPLNRLQPTRITTEDLEQRGCLHANMDLYKWAFKLAPFTASELVADCFALALEIREVDMRASPYDVRPLGFEPILIETETGRQQYEALQRDFSRRGEPLRARLLEVVERLLAAAVSSGTETPNAQSGPS